METMDEILLCTHDPILIKNIYGFLRDDGHSVEIADHLALAVQMVLKNPYQAFIVDGRLFGLSADDAVQIMKMVSPEMPVIVVGGRCDRQDALFVGMPVDLEELRTLVNRMHRSNNISH